MNNTLSSTPSFDPPPHKYAEGDAVKPRTVHVIINPVAGQDQPILRDLNQIFKDSGVDWEAFITKDSGDARRYARASAEGGADVVMACGGDGTVSETASGLRGTGVPLAILPCGTANVMSIEMAIPPLLTEAIAFVAEGRNRVRYVDMGMVAGQEFLLRVAVGMEAHMALDTPREAKTRWGNLAYAFTALNQLSNPPIARYTLILDGLHVEVEGISLMIANSGNVGISGVNIVHTTSVSDGLLDAILIRASDLPSLLRIASNVLINRAEEPPESVLHWQAKEIRVEAEPSQPAQADGEEISPTPLTAQVLPQAVSILVPQEPSNAAPAA